MTSVKQDTAAGPRRPITRAQAAWLDAESASWVEAGDLAAGTAGAHPRLVRDRVRRAPQHDGVDAARHADVRHRHPASHRLQLVGPARERQGRDPPGVGCRCIRRFRAGQRQGAFDDRRGRRLRGCPALRQRDLPDLAGPAHARRPPRRLHVVGARRAGDDDPGARRAASASPPRRSSSSGRSRRSSTSTARW